MKDLRRIIRRVADDPQGVTAQRKSPASAFGVCGIFYFFTFAFKLRLMLCSKEKTPALLRQSFFK